MVVKHQLKYLGNVTFVPNVFLQLKLHLSEELSLKVMMIDSLESENLLNNENNFKSIHENSNEDESEGENEDEDNDSYNTEVEEESLTSDISHSNTIVNRQK
ncbi:hypothetical protein Glove_334g96 [Diversispora epigaea]|uniref:Uncharacterized protein n=1 Tax=Diversispora epigaea TaxID=1348612 RepID=A0A397HIR3_9GLOM|nr:hypothetical protein Glove_334g96 [Diversispora epigaea]